MAGCRDSGAVAFTDLYDVLVNLPAREITVATHAKGNNFAFKPCTNVQHILHLEWCKLEILCSRDAVFVDFDVWDFSLTWSVIFMLLFWPFMICSDRLGQGHAPDKFAIAQITFNLDKLNRSLCKVDCFCDVWTEIIFNHLMYSVLSVSSCILLKTNFHAFSFWGYFIFLLLVFHKLVDLNRHFTLKLHNRIHDGVVVSSYLQMLRFCCIVISWIVKSLILVDWNWCFRGTHCCHLHLYPENISNIFPQNFSTHAGKHCLNWSASFNIWRKSYRVAHEMSFHFIIPLKIVTS